MATARDPAARAERVTPHIDRYGREPISRAQTAEGVRALATDLQSQVDAYLRAHCDLTRARREQLRQGTLQTALAAVRASLDETPEAVAVDYVNEAVRRAQETMALLEN